MASQDIIYTILPRPPAVPGSNGVAGEVRQVRQVTELDKKGGIKASGEDPNQQQGGRGAARPKPAKPAAADTAPEPDDPPHQIDLFV